MSFHRMKQNDLADGVYRALTNIMNEKSKQ